MTSRFQKSVGSSGCPSVCNADKNAYSSGINSGIIIRISDEMAWHLLQKNKAIFSSTFSNIFGEVFEKLRFSLLNLRY